MAFTPMRLADSAPLSKARPNSAALSARNLSASARLASRLMASTCSPRAAYLACMAFIHGKDCLHGPHHEAQKSTYTTLPCKSASLRATLPAGRSMSGAD